MRPADDAAAAVKQNDDHDFRVSLIGVGNKPTETPADTFIVARTRFAQTLFAVRVVATLGGTIENSGEHSLAQIGKERSDIELLTNARFEILALRFGTWVLQIILVAAVRQHSDEGGKLKRRDAYAFAEARHTRDTAEQRRRGRHGAGLLFRNVETRALAKSQKPVVLHHAIETQLRADGFEELVVRVRHRFREVDVAAIADFDHRVARDHAFLQARERDKWLNRRAWFEARGKSHVLIHDCENAAVRGIDRNYRTFFMSQSIHGNLADDRIVVGGDVILRGIRIFDDARMALVVQQARRMRWARSREGNHRPGDQGEAEDRNSLSKSWVQLHVKH